MRSIKLLIVLIVLVLVLSTPSMAAQIATLKIWIEGEVGVGLDCNEKLVIPLGGTNGTWVTVKNIGNIDDTIRLEGSLASTNDYAKDWIKFSFKCAETVGECDDTPTSQRHEVDNMRITPEMEETQFYIEVSAYKRNIEPTNITMNAYSLTEYKKDPGIMEIEIEIRDEGGWSIKELPGLSIYAVPLVLLIPVLIFYKEVV